MTRDVVGGGRPREGRGGGGDRARRETGRGGGRRCIGTGGGCDIRRGGAGDVACGIDGGDAERVGRAAGESGEAEARCSGCPDLGAVTEHAVAGHSDVVGRRVPGKRNGRLTHRARDEARRRRGRGGVRAGSRGDVLGGGAGDVAGGVDGGDTERVGRARRSAGVGVARASPRSRPASRPGRLDSRSPPCRRSTRSTKAQRTSGRSRWC